MINASDAHLSLVSAILMHNLALCQSAIGNYSAAIELIGMARETAKICRNETMSVHQPINQTPFEIPSVMTKNPNSILTLLFHMAGSVNESLALFQHQLNIELEASIANQNIMDVVLEGENVAASAG